MTLERQLRAALTQEADMQNAPAPDVDRLISGGRVRQRRRTRARAAVAAAAAVLVAGGVYGVTRMNPESAAEPTQSPSTTSPTPRTYVDNRQPIEPGTYRVYVGVDDTGVHDIDADITFHGSSWAAETYPVTREAGGIYGAVAVYRPTALAAGTGCLTDKTTTNVAQSAELVAQQLAQLPRSTVLQSPTPVQAFGGDAVHLRLRIPDDCGAGVYRVAMTPRGGHGISYGDHPNDVVIDFWVLDVAGVPVVVDTWHDEGASNQLVHQVARTRDSITFVTG